MGKKKTNKAFKTLPDEKKFLWLIAKSISPNDILYLSELDYGHGSAKHAERIFDFKQALDTSKFDYWYPMEVLELNRWSKPGHQNIIGHSRRAFSCTGLMDCYFNKISKPIESLDVLLPLFESLIRLDLPDWRCHFSNFIIDGISKTEAPEDVFNLQFTRFLTVLSETKVSSKLQAAYDQLMEDELSMLRHHWEMSWHKTWDPALEPELVRPAKINDTFITHSSAAMFTAKYVYQKAEQIDDSKLTENLKNLAQRIARLVSDESDGFFSESTIHL